MNARIPLAIAVVFLSSMMARGEGKDAAYFCVEEFSGGIGYNEYSKKWDGMRFNPEDKFVLRLKYIAPTGARGPWNADDKYNLTITNSGSSLIKQYKDFQGSEIVSVGNNGYLHCTASLYRYVFNIFNNRFLSIYAIGYVNGEDKAADTPSISGGTCTKID